MSEISLNIGYRNIIKKITCPKSYSINQLVGLAFEKFNIDKIANIGELKYNGKSLDSSLSLRFSNLTNNSKIELTVKQIPKEHYVNIKLLANLPTNEVKSYVLKINSNCVLRDIIEEFENSSKLNLLNHEGYLMQLQVINSRVDQRDFDKVTLNSITGLNVANVVIRLGYVSMNNESKIKEQQDIVKTQLEQQKIRNQLKKEQEENNRKLQKLDEPSSEEIGREDVVLEEPTASVDIAQERMNPAYPSEEDSSLSTNNKKENVTRKEKLNTQERSTTTATQESSTATQERSTPIADQKTSEGPQLFMPSKTPNKIYENPEDDYDMTLSQAQTYQQLIRNSAKPIKKSSTEAPVPLRYFIRVKFPDQTILQLDFENAKETKLGSLIKKIDELVLPKFVNSYLLKQSYPPFKTIDMSFAANNTYLVDHPCFKAERIVLIWEPASRSKGPYVNTQNIHDIKQANELPELVIENNRALLPEDAPHEYSDIPPSTSAWHSTNKPGKSESRGKQFPKWFKLK